MKKVEIKTKKNTASVAKYMRSIEDANRKKDCVWILETMRKVSGDKGSMWGTSIVGFGTTTYTRSNGAVGDWFRIGFSSRKQAISLYLMAYELKGHPLLEKLGKHGLGVGCLYIKKLADVDLKVLEKLIKLAYKSK